ncbi:MAG TPA: hypothetical protein VGB30_13680 [bacterium]|jgi:hypothetical protein
MSLRGVIVGHYSHSQRYYVCGSEPNRAGKGCGSAIYAPVEYVEERVVSDIQGIINQLVDREGFTKMVNAELRQMWETESGYNPDAEKHIKALDTKIQNVYKALEDGFQDAAWANSRLKELHAERDKLSASQTKQTKPLQVDAERAMRFRQYLYRVLSDDNLAERKKYVQNFIDSASLNPETRKLHIRYSVLFLCRE